MINYISETMSQLPDQGLLLNPRFQIRAIGRPQIGQTCEMRCSRVSVFHFSGFTEKTTRFVGWKEAQGTQIPKCSAVCKISFLYRFSSVPDRVSDPRIDQIKFF